MLSRRVIPVLLLQGERLVKTRRFADPVYLGDPVNAARIFSDKEADELVVLDIEASLAGREPNYDLIAEMAGECFMPVAYGGGVTGVEAAKRIIRSGVEKVVVTSAAARDPVVLSAIADTFGRQAVVAGLEVRAGPDGYRLSAWSGRRPVPMSLDEAVDRYVEAGAGELLLMDAGRDGTMTGYDLELIRQVKRRSPVPVIACGGAGDVAHLTEAFEAGASAAAAGSLFVFFGRRRAVLINYPEGLHA